MNPNQNVRAYIYRVSLAVFPLLVIYGLVDEKDAVVWAALVGVVLNQGLTVANTSTKKPE